LHISRDEFIHFDTNDNEVLIQGGSNMTGTDLCVNLATSVPVIFEPPCTIIVIVIFLDNLMQAKLMTQILRQNPVKVDKLV